VSSLIPEMTFVGRNPAGELSTLTELLFYLSYSKQELFNKMQSFSFQIRFCPCHVTVFASYPPSLAQCGTPSRDQAITCSAYFSELIKVNWSSKHLTSKILDVSAKSRTLPSFLDKVRFL